VGTVANYSCFNINRTGEMFAKGFGEKGFKFFASRCVQIVDQEPFWQGEQLLDNLTCVRNLGELKLLARSFNSNEMDSRMRNLNCLKQSFPNLKPISHTSYAINVGLVLSSRAFFAFLRVARARLSKVSEKSVDIERVSPPATCELSSQTCSSLSSSLCCSHSRPPCPEELPPRLAPR